MVEVTAKRVLKTSCLLGEGLYWQSGADSLFGVDIYGCMIWRWSLDAATFKTWHVPERVGWVLPTLNSNKLLLGLQGGFALFDGFNSLKFEWIQQPFLSNPCIRLNDAKADITGTVWGGSLNNDDESRSDGCLYRLGVDRNLKLVDGGYRVANGPAINMDSTLMLHSDSARRTIYAFDLNVHAGQLSNKRIWKVFTEDQGYPDGMCFDADGCVWVAHWGAGCISRFALDGALLSHIKLPVINVTNVCFGGKALDRLFVSTARSGLTPEQLKAQPEAGDLFEIINPGSRGLPCLPAGIY